MKKFKFLLIAALLVATAGAFAGNLTASCAEGPLFHYTGSDPNPPSDPQNFQPAADKDLCDASAQICTYYWDGSSYVPCPDNPPGVYIGTR